eukprot:31452-Pelagococcus_subviridis.AAC.5
MTPTPYTDACRTSASLSPHPARHGPMNPSRYFNDAPDASDACSMTSSKTQMAILGPFRTSERRGGVQRRQKRS